MLLAACQAGGSESGSYPDRPIEIVAAGTPGGGLDMLARGLADALAKEDLVSSPITVVNKPGGSMGIGMTYVAQQEGNPYVLMINAPGTLTTPLQGDLDVTYEDLTMLNGLVVDNYMVLVSASSPYETMDDLIAAAKEKPTGITVGGAQTGAPDHIFTQLIQDSTGVKFSYVPFDGGAEPLTNLVGGHVNAAIANASEAAGMLAAGKVKALAVATEERLADYPDVPTLTEGGIEVVRGFWRGLVGPAKMPRESIEFWDKTLDTLTTRPAWDEFLANSGMSDGYLHHKEFATFIEEENKVYTSVLDALNLSTP